MLNFTSKPVIALTPRKLRLRTTLVLPFVLQIIAAVGLVGYLSFRNGQKAVNDLADQMIQEVGNRVVQHLDTYLHAPQLVNRLNADAVSLGELELENLPKVEQHLFARLMQFESISSVQIGNFRNDFRLVTRQGGLRLLQSNPANPASIEEYVLNSTGRKAQRLNISQQSSVRNQLWYQAALFAGKPTWGTLSRLNNTGGLFLTANLPVYDRQGQERGVFSSAIFLNSINNFLSDLHVGKSGKVFILERDGWAAAVSGHTGSERDREFQRFNLISSPDPLARAAARSLLDRFGDFGRIDSIQQIVFSQHGERHFLRVMPFRDEYGLDWLILVVVPESDFMAQINANTRNTIMLCLVALAVAIVVGIITARWLTQPILRLTKASEQIAKGDLDQHVEPSAIREIEELANSFNSMSSQLKESFERLETQKNSFARFFPPEYLKFLNKHGVTNIALGDHVSKEMAVMFSDIRSFTTLSEKMTPKENFDFVNAYLRRVSPEIRAHDGFVVKFLGDGMMAVFPNGVDDAVAAGIDKFKRVQEYNRERETQGFLPIDVGMGIHVGHMMVGMVGEHNRIQGDAFSDNVNLTARLEGLTKFYGVSLLISEDVLDRLSNQQQYKIRFLDRAIVKGRTEPIAVYEVLDAETDAIRELKLNTLQPFEQGLQHYCRGNFADAKACFEQVLAVNPLDKTAKLYLERVQELLLEGTPANWNGVWAFTQK